MRILFNTGLLLLLPFIFFRLAHIRKEKMQLRTAIDADLTKSKARHYRYLTIFQCIMHGAWIAIGLYFVYYFFIR